MHVSLDALLVGTKVWFDPIGVRIEPEQTGRWIVHSNVHTTTAYHPKNDLHSLGSCEIVEPWDWRFLVSLGVQVGDLRCRETRCHSTRS